MRSIRCLSGTTQDFDVSEASFASLTAAEVRKKQFTLSTLSTGAVAADPGLLGITRRRAERRRMQASRTQANGRPLVTSISGARL